jgi:mannonate dehydratase
MRRRDFWKSLMAMPAVPLLAAQNYTDKTRGLPPLKITGGKVITASIGEVQRWVFLKVFTSEPGLYGIGSANDIYETQAVIAVLEKHLIPWMIGKDPDRIEDLWTSANYRTYLRYGPVNNQVLGALDEALWDIKGKRAGMPVYDLLGGKTRDAVACYDHTSGKTKEEALEAVHKSLEMGYRHIRVQYGEGGYGGGGFYAPGQASRPEGGYGGLAFDEDLYIATIPPVFEFLRSKLGFEPRFIHDVHSHLSGVNAVEFARRLNPYQMFFVEDILAPEQLQWYRNIRQVCSTPQAVGELFTHPLEYVPLMVDRLIDFVRCRVSSIGGITPARKIAALCEVFGVRTAFQEGGDNDPVGQLAAYHVDLSTQAFGIQEETHFPPVVHEMMPGCAELRKGYLYGNDKPGLGIDINEDLARKFPLKDVPAGGAYKTDRAVDGSVVRP